MLRSDSAFFGDDYPAGFTLVSPRIFSGWLLNHLHPAAGFGEEVFGPGEYGGSNRRRDPVCLRACHSAFELWFARLPMMAMSTGGQLGMSACAIWVTNACAEQVRDDYPVIGLSKGQEAVS